MLVEENYQPASPNIAQSAAEVAAEQDNNFKQDHISSMTRDTNDGRPEHRAVEYINADQVNVNLDTNNVEEMTNQMTNSKEHTPRMRRKKAKKYNSKQTTAYTKVYKEIKMSNGVLFKGLSSKKNPLSGEGQLIYQDGSLYVGEIKKGQANGHGEKIWSQLQVLSMKGFTPNQGSQ